METSNKSVSFSFNDIKYRQFDGMCSSLRYLIANIFVSKTLHLYCYCYFPNVSADMFSGLLQVFVELRNLHGTSKYVLY